MDKIFYFFETVIATFFVGVFAILFLAGWCALKLAIYFMPRSLKNRKPIDVKNVLSIVFPVSPYTLCNMRSFVDSGMDRLCNLWN